MNDQPKLRDRRLQWINSLNGERNENEAHTWPQTMGHVCSASDMSIHEWMEEYDRLKAKSYR